MADPRCDTQDEFVNEDITIIITLDQDKHSSTLFQNKKKIIKLLSNDNDG